jgi:hypothetical protein
MRQSALQEGLARYTKQGITEYGVGSGASLAPRIRGFQAGTACQQFVVDSGLITNQLPAGDSDCGQYELAIRKNVTTTRYTYKVQDIYDGLVLPVTGNASLVFTGLTSVLTSATLACQPTACSGTYPVVITTNATTITITGPVFAAGVKPTDDALVVTSVISDQTFTIGKGFTTIEATGFAPDGSESRSLTIIRPSGTVTALTTQRFNVQGICQPSADSCR